MTTTLNIPLWLAEKPDLSWNEKALYSIYFYFTFYADYRCCTLTNEQIGIRLGLEKKTVQRVKKKLLDAGYIKVSGIRVVALMTEEMATSERGDRNGTGGDRRSTGSTKSVTHNKEIIKNKESYNKGTYTEGNEVNNTGDSASESVGNRSSSWEAELREVLKKYISEGYQRGDVITLVRQCSMENRSVLDMLLKGYDWDKIPLRPLLKYYEEQPNDEVSKAIWLVLKDKDVEEYTEFCTLYDNGKGQ